MEELGSWSNGFTIKGDIENHTELAIAYGEDQTIADNLYWDFEPEEDDTFRRSQYNELLHHFIDNAQVIDTETLSGLIIDVTEQFDTTGEGRARGIYTLKSEDTGAVYAANSTDLARLVSLMENYTESEEAETSDDAEPSN